MTKKFSLLEEMAEIGSCSNSVGRHIDSIFKNGRSHNQIGVEEERVTASGSVHGDDSSNAEFQEANGESQEANGESYGAQDLVKCSIHKGVRH